MRSNGPSFFKILLIIQNKVLPLSYLRKIKTQCNDEKQFKSNSKAIQKQFIVLLSFILMSCGGGLGPGLGPGGGKTKVCSTKEVSLRLSEGSLFIDILKIDGRKDSYYPMFMPPHNNIFNKPGGYKSPTSESKDTRLNFCKITIGTLACSNYGNKGKKVYTWDSTGNTNPRAMKIEDLSGNLKVLIVFLLTS